MASFTPHTQLPPERLGRPDSESCVRGLLPARLARLFPDAPVAGEEIRLSGAEDIPAPRPEEAAQVARAVTRRRLEFAAGRHCARRAFARLGGVGDFLLLNDDDRAPRWPEGFVGSLTHTGGVPDGYCAAVLGRSSDIAAVGLDAEEAEPLEPELWRFVLTDEERDSLAALGADAADAGARRDVLAKVIFSAKECYYKAQFPLTRRFLGFREVQIDLDLVRGEFAARLLTSTDADAGAGGARGIPHCRGRFSIDAGIILTGIVLAREAHG